MQALYLPYEVQLDDQTRTCCLTGEDRNGQPFGVGSGATLEESEQALREYVFTGRDSSIALSQAPSRIVNRDWIVVTREDGDRQLRLPSDSTRRKPPRQLQGKRRKSTL